MSRNTLFLILKYELKSFINYLAQKSTRMIGFVITIIIEILYLVFLFVIIPPSMISPYLGLDFKRMIAVSAPSVLMFIAYLSFTAGLSLVVTVRKGARAQIEIFLLAPTSPNRVLFYFMAIQALATASLITEFMFPMLIWILLATGFSLSNILLFIIVCFVNIVSFSFIGAVVGIVFIRMGTKKRMYLTIIGITILSLFYLFVYGGEYFGTILWDIALFLNSDFFPFKWLAFPLFLETIDLNTAIYYALSGIFFIFGLMYIAFRTVSERFFTGRLKPPVEYYRMELKPGFIDKLFAPPTSGLIKKELKLISREPSLAGALFGLLAIMIFMIIGLSFSVESSMTEFIALMIAPVILMMMMAIPTSYISTSLAMERYGLAIILSSPASGKDFLRPKILLTGIVMLFAIIIELIIFTVVLHTHLVILAITSVVLLGSIPLSLSLGAYISTHYTNFKAENPRKALTSMGSIMMLVSMFVVYFAVMGILLLYAFLSDIVSIALSLVYITLSGFLSLRLLRKAYLKLNSLECIEYL